MTESFLFIPDISGFTNFVQKTELNHSRHIISELLEALLDSNILKLELAEIEGDALFYYKSNTIPSKEAIMDQVQKMYLAFHKYLKDYETKRICPCGACETAINLKLKFVAHAGVFDFIKVRDIRKPYGESVIQVHRILKNSINLNEYLLVSKDLWNNFDNAISSPQEEWLDSKDEFDFGSFHYSYLNLRSWKELVKIEKHDGPDINKEPDIVISKNIAMSPKALFEFLSNFEYRMKWTEGIEDLTYKKNQVNRSGSSHVCVLKNRKLNIESFVERRENSTLVLGELTTDPPLADSVTTLYIVKPSSDGKGSELTFEVRFEGSSFLYKILRPIFLMQFRKILKKNIDNIARMAPDFMRNL